MGGLLYGQGWHQLQMQALAAIVIIVFDAVMTFVVLKVVSLVVPLRASNPEMEGGDLAIHGIDPMPVYVGPGLRSGGAPAN
ncbi:MAG: hypothetical protein NVS3B16_27140 [Vulcanimicrobiaceae bacterium]